MTSDARRAFSTPSKRVRAGKWSLWSTKSLAEMAQLATYLLALGRHPEAPEIGEFVSDIVCF
jgi:hypothetical protein